MRRGQTKGATSYKGLVLRPAFEIRLSTWISFFDSLEKKPIKGVINHSRILFIGDINEAKESTCGVNTQ